MAAPVVVGGVVTTVTLTDSDGNLLGTAENPIQVEAHELRKALEDVVEELKDFKDTVKVIAS